MPMQPMSAPPAPSSSKMGMGLSVVAVILAVLALVMSLVIPGPVGVKGDAGAPGATGAIGPTGNTGPQGPQGPAGTAGTNGINCWDLNQNGVPDPATEDLNLDGLVNVLDCQGAQGPAGPQGPQGPPGPGTIMAYSERVATQALVGCTNYLSVTITVPSAGSVTLVSSLHVWIDHTNGVTDGWTFMTRTTATDCSISFADPHSFLMEVSGAAPTDSTINMGGALTNMYPVAAAGTYTFYLNSQMYSGESAGDTAVNGSVIATFFPG